MTPRLLRGKSTPTIRAILRYLIDSVNADQRATQLALTLLELWIFLIDNIDLAFAAYDLAVDGAFLNRCSNFHNGRFSV